MFDDVIRLTHYATSVWRRSKPSWVRYFSVQTVMRLCLGLCTTAFFSFASTTFAQQTKYLTVIVPFAPGGTVDIVARQLAPDLTSVLGESVLIDNRGGAGGTIGSAKLAQATADGHTIMFHHMGVAINASLYDNLTFDSKIDLVPLAYIGATPNVLVTSNKFQAKTVQEFLDYAKQHPFKLNYGSGGVGSAGHLAMETFQHAAGVQLTHVPYKGSGPAIADLISGQIQVMLVTMAAIKPYIDSGQVRAIASSGLERPAALDQIPTLAQAGLSGFQYEPWFGAFAPKGTPESEMDRLHTAINATLKNPDNQNKLKTQGLEVKLKTRQEFAEIYTQDIGRWAKIIKAINLKPE